MDSCRWITRACSPRNVERLLDGPVPGYVPTVRGGGKMHVRMLCLGRHWNGRTTRSEARALPTSTAYRSSASGRLTPSLARGVSRGYGRLTPDLSILNYYGADGRMGLHQDKDEHPRIDRGRHSRRLGVAGGHRALPARRAEAEGAVEAFLLESGDVFVFGGPARLRYHGVSRTIPGSAPPMLTLEGRFNVTLRQYDV